MQNNYNKESAFGCEVTYAGFWVRLAAYFLDSVIVFLLLLVVRLTLLGVTAWTKGTVLDGNLLFHYSFTDIVLYAGQILYFILFTYTSGTTPGKRAMNLRVAGAEASEKPGLFTIVYRETVGRFLSGFFLGIGYWVIGMNPQKQGIHDMLCDTHVIYAKRVKGIPVYQVPPRPPVPPCPVEKPPFPGQDREEGAPSMRPSSLDGPYRMVKEEPHVGMPSGERYPGNFYPAEPHSERGESSRADRILKQQDSSEIGNEMGEEDAPFERTEEREQKEDRTE